MKTIAYPGYHDPDDFEHIHLPEISERSFDTILFPVCEQTWQFNLDNVRQMRDVAEDAGYDTWAGPWGLCNMFGGEAISTYKADSPDAEVYLELWKNDLINIGFKTVFMDEPQVDCDPDNLVRWFERQRLTTMPEIKLFTSLETSMFDDMSDDHIRNLPVDSLGLSCYHWRPSASKIMEDTNRWIDRLVTLRPRDNHVWIQGFGLPDGDEWVPVLTQSLAQSAGARDFAHWSFRGTRGTADKTCVNWRRVWDNMRG